MKKSTVIATCLLNTRMITQLADAEAAVERVFGDEFPDEDFAHWNQQVSSQVSENIISGAWERQVRSTSASLSKNCGEPNLNTETGNPSYPVGLSLTCPGKGADL